MNNQISFETNTPEIEVKDVSEKPNKEVDTPVLKDIPDILIGCIEHTTAYQRYLQQREEYYKRNT